MKIGSKVVCIKDHPVGNGYARIISGSLPKKGDVLTVRAVYQSNVSGRTLLNFDEVVFNINHQTGREYGFSASYFREIDNELSHHTTETLIEELEEQLQPC